MPITPTPDKTGDDPPRRAVSTQVPDNTEAHAATDKQRPTARGRVVLSSYIGSTIEWFDFYIYGLASSLYFADAFFPSVSSLAGLLASFGTMAGGFIVRPLGGIIGGHFGDKYGRKKVLVASMLLMGASTFLVGVLPSYATIGIWAPIFLVVLRIVQGLGAGAEWGGGVLMVIEHFAKGRRGFWGSIGTLGVYSGITISTLLFYFVSKISGGGQTEAWRIPFLCSAALIIVGLWIRLGVAESPQFEKAARRDGTRTRMPLVELFRGRWGNVVIGIALAIGPAVPYQVYVTFGNSYGKLQGIPISTLLILQFTASVLAMVLAPAFGALSDVTGRRPIVIAGCVIMCPSAYYFFHAMNTGDITNIMVALIVLEIGHSMVYGPQSALLSELFNARTRYTGTSIAYQIAGALSGLAPIVSASLLALSGGAPYVMLVPTLLVLTSAGTVIAALVTSETSRRPLPE